MKRAIVLLLCAVLQACASYATAPRTEEYFASRGLSADDQLSLLSSDAEQLADDDLRRMLEYRYTPRPLSRVALVPFGWELRSRWSEPLAQSVAVVDAELVETLSASPRIFDASFLPSMLVPEQRTVPKLREAAARYQADLLLVFSSSCQAFQSSRLIQDDSARAYCRVEAALLDVRTGLVPFSAASTEVVETTEAESDLVTQEMVLRAEVDAISTALGEIAAAVVAFVEADPPPL
jgi:hypothetical protein